MEDLSSRAIIASVVRRAKELAIKRAISDRDPGAGIRAVDLRERCVRIPRTNYFPSDSVED